MCSSQIGTSIALDRTLQHLHLCTPYIHHLYRYIVLQCTETKNAATSENGFEKGSLEGKNTFCAFVRHKWQKVRVTAVVSRESKEFHIHISLQSYSFKYTVHVFPLQPNEL